MDYICKNCGSKLLWAQKCKCMSKETTLEEWELLVKKDLPSKESVEYISKIDKLSNTKDIVTTIADLNKLYPEGSGTNIYHTLNASNMVEVYVREKNGWWFEGLTTIEEHNRTVTETTISLNDYVIFTPNILGIRLYEERYKHYGTDFPQLFTPPSYEKDKQEDGSLKLPLWDFMNVYGEHMGNGFDTPFSSDLKIVRKK